RDRPELPGPDGQVGVEWCAGAPGIVIGAADYVDDDLLVAGAELTWRTGPANLDKGPGICHGASGEGWALLKAVARPKDGRTRHLSETVSSVVTDEYATNVAD